MNRFWALIVIFVILVFAFCIECKASQVLGVNSKINAQIVNANEHEILEFNIEDYDKIIDDLGLEIHSCKQVSGRKIIEGYSGKLKDFVVINGMRVNVQMSITDEKIIFGYPLISGAF